MSEQPLEDDSQLTAAEKRAKAYRLAGRIPVLPGPRLQRVPPVALPRATPQPVVRTPKSIPRKESPMAPIWAYGVTTVPSRVDDLLPKTLASLSAAGFDSPRLFVDGERDPARYSHFDLEATFHWPNLRTFGNWVTALWELYLRNPAATRFALFQDDFITYRNLRSYLERSPMPERSYLNLFTFPSNQILAPSKDYVGWYKSNQLGRGAVALVFDRPGVLALLQSKSFVEKPMDVHRGHKAVDGGIVEAMKHAGYTEYVHSPSLTYHTGLVSSMKNPRHPQTTSFRGEQFDVMELLSVRG